LNVHHLSGRHVAVNINTGGRLRHIQTSRYIRTL
jgi:hypothetical protein